MPLEQPKFQADDNQRGDDFSSGFMSQKNITAQEYQNFRQFLESASGIVLGDSKHYLVTSRLKRLMESASIESFSDLMHSIKRDERLKKKILDAMTTNETSWFRDTYPYDILKEKLLPELAKTKLPRVKIWSAACSTGQEPYSISMVVSEYLGANPGALQSAQVEIIGTDISSDVLENAKRGIYDESSAGRGLTAERKKRFFHFENGQWRINDELKRRIAFREMNLMQSYVLLGKFDVIFCRNVLIYFSTELKKDIMLRMSQALNPGGYLILGGSESTSGYSESFDLIRWKSGVIYQLKPKKR